MMKLSRFGILFLMFILYSCLPDCPDTVNSRAERDDYLIYKMGERLMFYDPVIDIREALLPGWEVIRFSISASNRLAFSSNKEGSSNIYVLDFPFTDPSPAPLPLDKSKDHYVYSWSPDGHYLAFDTVQGAGRTLCIWDGKTVSPIYQHQNHLSEITWSLDGRLAFTDFYSNKESEPSEVFIWEGGRTMSVSQNPAGEDRFPAWNARGNLAFLSERDGEYDIFVWDGRSEVDGKPDVHSFENIAPDLTDYYSDPHWTNADHLTLISFGLEDRYAQVYEWDGQTAHNISQNPGLHNGSQRWRKDGYWSFVTFFSPRQLLYVRDKANQTQLTVEGQYPPAWSERGRLMFCQNKQREWALSLWDGKNVIEVARGPEIEAQWPNGSDVFCSFG